MIQYGDQSKNHVENYNEVYIPASLSYSSRGLVRRNGLAGSPGISPQHIVMAYAR